MQQRIASQTEALEIAMKLENSPVGKTKVGMNQIQLQLANLTIQLQDIKKGRDIKKYGALDVGQKGITTINVWTFASICRQEPQIH